MTVDTDPIRTALHRYGKQLIDDEEIVVWQEATRALDEIEANQANPQRFARCPKHGLHGCRDTCFVCGGPVEQVFMVPA